MLFPKGLAERMKAHAGESYRPSNGTEGEIFKEWYCYNCKAEFLCDISAKTMFYNETDPNYPKEWIIREDGQPTCTVFEKESE